MFSEQIKGTDCLCCRLGGKPLQPQIDFFA